MRPRIELLLAFLGLTAGLIGAYFYGLHAAPQAPAFNPAANPYAKGIYAEGIVESYQNNGENINIYPKVAGTIVEIPVHEGQSVRRGTILLRMDDSVQRATAEQQKSQAEAAHAMLEELRAEPRKETFEVSKAQVIYARAQLKNAQDELQKQEASYQLDPKSVSKYTLDDAINAVKVAAANLKVVQKQYELTKAGAWIYDIRNQEKTYQADEKAYLSSKCPARLVHDHGAGRRHDSCDSGSGWQLRRPAGYLRYVHAGIRPGRRNGSVRRICQRPLLHRRNTHTQAGPRTSDAGANVHSGHEHQRAT